MHKHLADNCVLPYSLSIASIQGSGSYTIGSRGLCRVDDGFLTSVQPTFEALLKLDIFRENVSLLFKMRTNMKDRKYNLGLPKQS